jgi:hypothetical protein
LLRAVAACAFEGLAEDVAVVPKDSSTGGPTWTTLEAEKVRILESSSQLWQVLIAMGGLTPDSLLMAYQAYHAMALTSMGERSQADAPGKERAIINPAGEEQVANKTFLQPLWRLESPGSTKLIKDERFGRRRRRHVNAVSAGMHAFELMIYTLVQAYSLYAFAYTWKHTSINQLNQKVSPWPHAVSVDVKQFDSTITRQAGEVCHEAACRLFQAELEPIFRGLDHIPLLIRDGQGGWRWIGDPFDPSTWVDFLGQLSGRPPNPTANRVYGTYLGLVAVDTALRKLGRPGVEPNEVREILCGRDSRFALLNSGDDMVILLGDAVLRAALISVIESEEGMPYSKLDMDPKGTFLGLHLVREGGVLSFVPGLVNYFVNYWEPEYGAHTRDRRASSAAHTIRWLYHYGHHPCSVDGRRIEDEVHGRWYSISGAPLSLTRRLQMCPDPVLPADPRMLIWPSGNYYGRWSARELPLVDIRAKYIILQYEQLIKYVGWAIRPGVRVLTRAELGEVTQATGADKWLSIPYLRPAPNL